MPKKKKLKLNELKVKSFVTVLSDESKAVKGGSVSICKTCGLECSVGCPETYDTECPSCGGTCRTECGSCETCATCGPSCPWSECKTCGPECTLVY
jgi:hypothetical protein